MPLTPGDEPRTGPHWFRFRDLAPETLGRIVDDCRRHPNAQPHKHPGDPQMQWRSGRNAWEDRNPAGADYGRGRSFPALTPYLGADGLIYLRET